MSLLRLFPVVVVVVVLVVARNSAGSIDDTFFYPSRCFCFHCFCRCPGDCGCGHLLYICCRCVQFSLSIGTKKDSL